MLPLLFWQLVSWPKNKSFIMDVWWKKPPLHFHEKCRAWPKHPAGPLTGATAKKTMRSSTRLCCAFFKWDFSSGKRLKTCRVWQACGALSGMGFWGKRLVCVVLLLFHTSQQWPVDFATLYFMFLKGFRNFKYPKQHGYWRQGQFPLKQRFESTLKPSYKVKINAI